MSIKKLQILSLLSLSLAAPMMVTPMSAAQDPVDNDPYQWLEDVTGDKAIEWVKERNAKAESSLTTSDEFKKLESDLLAILDSDARIPFVSKHGEFYYNFWRDKKNIKGLWRRTTLEEFKKPAPQWEVILDLDKLSAEENESWVWKGASFLRPDYDRVLIDISRGGADATVTREFEISTKSFVKGGFERPEAKGSLSWIDRDHVFVQTDFGPGSMTDSGYARIVKRWKRDTPLAAAEVIYEGEQTDMLVAAFHDDSPGFERNYVQRNVKFYNDELFVLDENSKLVKIDAPNTASKSVSRGTLAIELREDWNRGDK
ncbi:MAG: hypothetical protein ACK5PB_18650, partial [Pirellula sp.]